MTIHQAILHGETLLSKHGIVDPRWYSERLLILALLRTRAHIYADLNRDLTLEELATFESLLSKRSEHYPLAYLEGIQEFCGREFIVNESVLIPRPETEEIIYALRDLPVPPNPVMLDLGSGSGCIAVTLRLEFPARLVVALEASPGAIGVLHKNAESHVRIVRGNFHSLCFQPRTFDVIVANLPYVELSEYEGLPRETKWEPRTALVADSLEESYQSVMQQCSLVLKSGGYLLMEFGYRQLERLQNIAATVPELKVIGVRPDQQNIPRVLILQAES